MCGLMPFFLNLDWEGDSRKSMQDLTGTLLARGLSYVPQVNPEP